MFATRGELKKRARAALRRGTPRPIWVTLLFLALTAGLALVLQGVYFGVLWGREIVYALERGYELHEVLAALSKGAAAKGFFPLLLTLYTTVFTVGYMGYTLRLLRAESTGYSDIFQGFGMAGRVIVLYILQTIFVTLWAMLFVFPGIIAAYRYRLAYYFLLDDPSSGALEALRRSKAAMVGHKLDLFVLDVSFVGWYLLAGLVGFVGVGLLGLAGGLFGIGGLLFNSVKMLAGAALGGLLSLWITQYTTTTNSAFYDCLVGGGGWTPEDSLF